MAHNVMGIDPCDSQHHAIFNATTQKRTLVDPRTGLFEVFVPLPPVIGNSGSGPVVDMSLSYTPVANNAASLGDGWSFLFTTYHETTKQLTLHSGEQLEVTKGQKLDSFAVKVEWESNNTVLKVSRRDGRVETLKQVGSSKIYVPEKLTTDGYNSLTLSWQAKAHTIDKKEHFQIQLLQIKDAARTLVKVDYSALPASATITFWPDDSSEKLAFSLALTDHALRTVTAPEGTKSTFGYTDHATCGWLLSSVETFEGLKEEVVYKDEGLKFSNAKLTALPVVASHKLTPRGGTQCTATYTYKRVSDEQYTTTKAEGSGSTARTTEYHYGKLHEQVKEVVVQGEYETQTLFKSLPIGQSSLSTTSIRQLKKGELQQEESIGNGFDLRGNLAFNVQAGMRSDFFYELDGHDPRLENIKLVSLTNEFHKVPAAGNARTIFPGRYKILESCCFSNSSGFEKAVEGKCGALFNKFYSYVYVAGLSELKVETMEQVVEASGKSGERAGFTQRFTYHSSEDFRKGRQASIAVESGGVAKPEVTVDYTLSSISLTTKTTETSAGASRSRSETHSILSGRLVSQLDEDGNRADYKYDAHHRLIEQTLCAQSTDYKQTTAYAYPSPGRVEITEPGGQQQAIEEDGQGNTVAEYRRNSSKDKWQQTLKVSYDDLGRKLRTTQYDYLANGTPITEWQELQYDNWGAVCGCKFSDGREVFNQYDPKTRTRREWTGKADDKHHTVTAYNSDGTVSKIEWLNSSGTAYQTQTFAYNDFRLVKTLTTQGVHGSTVITYDYDAVGRVLSEKHVEKGKETNAKEFSYTYKYSYPADWLIKEAEQISIEFDGKTRILGKRAFDSWGRATSITRGDCTETYTYSGASAVPSSKKTADAKTLSYKYIKELGNRISEVSEAGGIKKTFTYATGKVATSTASEGETFLEFQHDLKGLITAQRAASKKADTAKSKNIQRTYSPGGRLLTETDALGLKTVYDYNSIGQRISTVSDGHKTIHVYDSQGRLSKEVSFADKNEAVVEYSYDALGRETNRRVQIGGYAHTPYELKRHLWDDGSLKETELVVGGTKGKRSMTYTAGGRLASCTTTGECRPKTPKGKRVDSQVFSYDALGNVVTCVTQFGSETCTSTYSYDATSGCRLDKVQHSHDDYKPVVDLAYDKAGRLTKDQNGKTYTYDALGRLTKAGSAHYAYDAMDRLMLRHTDEDKQQYQFIYDGMQLRGEYSTADTTNARHIIAGSSACTMLKVKRSGVDRVLLQFCDIEGTVLITHGYNASSFAYHVYDAFGSEASGDKDTLLGFKGEYRDASTGQSPLGQGYRWYDPDRRQFNAQDSLSPFAEGGPHTYGFCCEGNPVAYSDPSGHVGAGAINRGLRRTWGDSLPGPVSMGKSGALISTIIWSGIGILTAALTGGTSLMWTAAMVGLAIAASATAIAGVVVSDSDPQASRILGWVSFGLTLVGGAAQMLRALARSGLKLAQKLHHEINVRVQHVRAGHGIGKAGLAPYVYDGIELAELGQVDTGLMNGNDLAPGLTGLGAGSGVGNQVTLMFQGGPATPGRALGNAGSVTSGSMRRMLENALREYRVDLGTVIVCAPTGALGNAGYFDSEPAMFINGFINNGTGLKWGAFNLGRYL